MAQLDVKAHEAKTTGSTQETIDPTTGGVNVFVAGGAQLPAALGPTTPALSLSVTDAKVSFVSAANVDCTTAHKVTAETGSGYLTITNLDASATIYVGALGVTGSTNGMAIPPGQRDTAYWADLALVYAIGSTTVNGCVRR